MHLSFLSFAKLIVVDINVYTFDPFAKASSLSRILSDEVRDNIGLLQFINQILIVEAL